MALHKQLLEKGASDASFERLEALFDQLANPKSDKTALLQAILAFQAELSSPSASATVEGSSAPLASETLASDSATASVTEASNPKEETSSEELPTVTGEKENAPASPVEGETQE